MCVARLISSVMSLLVCVSIAADEHKIAVLYARHQTSTTNFTGLHKFLALHTAATYSIQTFYQDFVGDTVEVLDYVPQIVMDCSVQQLYIQANAKVFTKSARVFLCGDVIPANSLEKQLKAAIYTSWLGCVSRLINYFGFTEALLIVEADLFVMLEKDLVDPVITLIPVSHDETQYLVDNLISRSIRSSGVKPLFIMGNSKITNKILNSLAMFEMDEGYAVFLLGSDCQFDTSLFPTGVLCVALAGAETALSESEAEYWYVLYALRSLPLTQFTVTDLIQGQKVTIGLIDFAEGVMTMSQIVVFPKGLMVHPNTSPTVFKVNLNNWTYDRGPFDFKAAALALDDVKLSSRKFTVRATALNDCDSFHPTTFYLPCYVAVKSHRVSILHSLGNASDLMSTLEFMRKTGLRLYLVDMLTPISQLTRIDVYPNFSRLAMNLDYFSLQTLQLLKYFKYYSFNFFVSNRFGPTFVEDVRAFIASTSLYIETPLEDQEYDSDNPDPAYFERAAKIIKASHIRPVLALLYPEEYSKLNEALSEEGVIPEEEVVLISGSRSLTTLDTMDSNTAKYASSYIFIRQAYFQGEIGEDLRLRLLSQFKSASLEDCYCYDQMKQAVLAIDFALKRGLNLYKWQDISFAVRSVRFLGCSGFVTQSFLNNDRGDLKFSVHHIQETERGKEEVKIMELSLEGLHSYRMFNAILWADGTSEAPKLHMFSYKDCPFPEEYRQSSPRSQIQSVLIGFGLCAFAIGCALAVYCLRFRRLQVTRNVEPILLGTQDLIVITGYVIDTILLAIVCPSNRLINQLPFLMDAPWTRLDLSDEKLFSLLTATYIVVVCWVALCLINLLIKVQSIQITVAILDHWLGSVILFLLLVVYDCNEAASRSDDPEMAESFLDVDCSNNCWSGKHAIYAWVTGAVAVVFVAISTLTIYTNTNTLEGFQMEAKAEGLLLKKPFMLLMFSLLKSRGLLTDISSAVVEVLAVSCLLVFKLKVKAFNIQLVNLWLNYCLSVVITVSIYSTIMSAYPNFLLWLGLSLLTIFALGIFVLRFSKKLPQDLKAPQKIGLEGLFKFAFTFRTTL